MYHSVTFGNKNSYSDWHLVPDSRPVIVMPEQKKEVVDVPGGNSVIDMSMSLTKFPIFNRRSGSLRFHVLNGYRNWKDLYEEIAMYLHGQKMNMLLEDDPNFYYTGYFSVNWTSNNDGTWSDIEIGYDLEPYKYARIASSIGGSREVLASSSEYNISIPSSELDPSLPTPLILEVTNCHNSPKIAVGFTNSFLGISENPVRNVDTNNDGHNDTYITPYLITSNGTYTIQKYPICGKTTSDMANIRVRINLSSMSTSSSAYATVTPKFRRAKL